MLEQLSLLSFASGGWGSALLAGSLVTIALALSCLPIGLPLGLPMLLRKAGYVVAVSLALYLLAPVIRERKGEHLSVFEELRAQGFVRARINGKLYELDEAPKLDKQKKHSIDVVVDRFKVRADLQQRLAESFETALKLADGIALVAPMDDEPGEEIIFSARFACPISKMMPMIAIMPRSLPLRINLHDPQHRHPIHHFRPFGRGQKQPGQGPDRRRRADPHLGVAHHPRHASG